MPRQAASPDYRGPAPTAMGQGVYLYIVDTGRAPSWFFSGIRPVGPY